MKKFKLIFLFVVLALITVTLTACPIVPYRFQWGMGSIRLDVEYINGNTLSTTLTQGVSFYNPYGIHAQTTYIKFFEDNTLIFKPFNEEELSGTYKTKNNGIKNTTIYITLENGDKIEALGAGGYLDDTLFFEYHNVDYEFSSRSSHQNSCADQNEYREQLRSMVREVRYYWENRYGLVFGKVTFNENEGAILETNGKKTDLYAENVGVIAIRITDNNEVIYLDSIEEGDCATFNIDSYYDSNRTQIIVLFYIDPLPNFEQENPQPMSIFDLIPELEAYYEDGVAENITIKLSNELINFAPGHYHSYNNVTDPYHINKILSMLEKMTLWDYGAPDENYLNNPYSIDSIQITDTTGTLPEIVISNYYEWIKIDDKYYFHSANEFPSFIYKDSFRVFACQNYEAEIYKNETLLGYTDIIKNIEYIIDPENEHNYTALHETRILLTEFGKITVYDATHFWYKGQFYLVVGQTTFEELFK